MAASLTHQKPPVGALVAITDRGATGHYVATIDLHLGRYFYAGCHRFHVADDSVPLPAAEQRTWQTATATAVLLRPEEYEMAGPPAAPAPASSSLTSLPVDLGPREPTEQW
jgi:hypothetical protein